MRSRRRVWVLAALAALTGAGLSSPAGAEPLPPLPARWPARLELGLSDGPGGAARLAGETRWGFRYQYLSGAVNTGGGWASWNDPPGAFVTAYVRESLDAGIVPVFSYYTLRQSAPGSALSEDLAVLTNLATPATMRDYYADLRLFFQRAGAFPGALVVLHVEPDLWGYLHRAAPGDEAAAVPAAVASTGLTDLADLPDTAAGFARAIARLRNQHAPNVVLAYHLSVWGTGTDIAAGDPPDFVVDDLAARAARFFASLGGGFDLAFAEFADRDAGYRQHVLGDGGAAWWDAADFTRMARFLGGFARGAGTRVGMWQIPLGNTRMRAMNNTWGHYQDNRVEWLLDDPGRARLAAYADAGVVALLFGPTEPGTTCACDAAHDGITDPAPINGNTGLSLSADDDGGFFRARAAAYYQAGALLLPGSAAAPDDGTGVVTGAGPGGVARVRGFTAAGQPEAPDVVVFDAGFRGGVFVAAGDVFGTGRRAVIVGAGAGGGPHVRVLAADGGDTGVGFLPYAPAFAGGVRVASCDVDGDGRAEIITAPGPGGGPHVRVFAIGAAGVEERSGLFAYDPGFTGGVFVACADLDGDGRAEILTGADAGAGPHVRVFALVGGVPIERAGFMAFDGRFAGGVRVAAGMLDGRSTVVAGAGAGGGPHVRLFEWAGGALRDAGGFFAYDPAFTGGVHVAAGRVGGVDRIITGPGSGGGPHVRLFAADGSADGPGFLAADAAFTGGATVAPR